MLRRGVWIRFWSPCGQFTSMCRGAAVHIGIFLLTVNFTSTTNLSTHRVFVRADMSVLMCLVHLLISTVSHTGIYAHFPSLHLAMPLTLPSNIPILRRTFERRD